MPNEAKKKNQNGQKPSEDVIAAKAPNPLTRGARVASKEDAIIAAAYEMFSTLGVAKTTIAEIARRAGVAEGMLYLYFSNKESIARRVLDVFYEALTEKAQAGVDTIDETQDLIAFPARHHLDSIL